MKRIDRRERDRQIVLDFKSGRSMANLAAKYDLTRREIETIIRKWMNQ